MLFSVLPAKLSSASYDFWTSKPRLSKQGTKTGPSGTPKLIIDSHSFTPVLTDNPSNLAFNINGALDFAFIANLHFVAVHVKFCSRSTPRYLKALTTSNSCKPRKYDDLSLQLPPQSDAKVLKLRNPRYQTRIPTVRCSVGVGILVWY